MSVSFPSQQPGLNYLAEGGTVGTFNANSTSLGAANEINVFVYRPDFVKVCAKQLEKDLGQSKPVTVEQARDRGFVDQAWDELAGAVFSLADVVVGPSDPSR